MNDFLLYSIVASIVLTVAINVLPQLFPGPAQRAEEKLREALKNSIENQRQTPGPRVRVFFPWKSMLVVSLVLTLVVNLIGWISGF